MKGAEGERDGVDDDEDARSCVTTTSSGCGWSDLSLNESWDEDSGFAGDDDLFDNRHGFVYSGEHSPEYDDTVRRMLDFVFD